MIDFKTAADYVRARLDRGTLTPEDVAKLTAAFQEHAGLAVDGMPGDKTLAILNAPAPIAMPPRTQPPRLVDRRAFAAQAHGPKREWKVYGRPWSKVTGVCLHQTACVLGERDERWDSVGAHVGITASGKIEWLHGFDRVVAAANGFNAQTVSIEVDGRFEGVEGDPSTLWDDPSTPVREAATTFTPAQVAAVKDAVRWIVAEVAAHGGQVKVLVAHRQSSGQRRSDPGSAIWRRAALPLIAELGLHDGGHGFKIDDGYPIPEAWDPSRVGIRY